MSKGNGALKLLSNNMSNGIFPVTKDILALNDETLKLLSQKHPEARDGDVLLEGDIPEIHPIIFETID